MTTSSHPTDTPGAAVAHRDAPAAPAAPRGADPGPSFLMASDHERRLWARCAALARADWLPEGVRGKAGNIFAVALLGEQFKLDTMPAALNIHIIESRRDGKKSVVLSAQLWIKLARDAGHKVRAKKGHPTDSECTVYLWRGDEDDDEPYEATYTMEQARKAGLVREGGNYEKNPQDMLFARAAVRVIRRAAGEVALANAVDEYEAEAMQRDEDPRPAGRPGNLADAAAAREPRAAEPDPAVTDAEVVEEPAAPTAEQLADLERAHAPGPDLDAGHGRPDRGTEPDPADPRWGVTDEARRYRQQSAGVAPTPEEVDERRIAGEGDDPADEPAETEARAPRPDDWAPEPEEPAETWTPTAPDPWGIEPEPAGEVPTEAQRALLEALEQGASIPVHPRTRQAVYDRGWTEYSSTSNPPGRIVLTRAGLAALDRARGQQ